MYDYILEIKMKEPYNSESGRSQKGKSKSGTQQQEYQLTCLCNNAETAVTPAKNSFQQMYLLHDEISRENLSNTMLKKLTTISCDLQKNMSHLFIEVERLIETTRYYAQPLSNQTNALKELRHQNNVRQRQLEIALKKLEIMSGRNQQLEKQHVIGKWERLFLKCSSFKTGNLGWRNTVAEYKEKMKKSESVAYLFRNLQSDGSGESISDDANSLSPSHGENDLHFSSDNERDTPLDRLSSSSIEEELMFETRVAESSVLDWVSKNSISRV